jgi:hypothetical protein
VRRSTERAERQRRSVAGSGATAAARDRAPEEWDGGEWVDVGADGLWRPSRRERFRALVVLGVVLLALVAVAGALSVGGDDDDEDDEVAATSTSSTIVATTASTTTEPIDPTSVGGEPAPEPCRFDDRGSAPLRDRGTVPVLVLNGTSRGGHAGEVADRLERVGYRTVEPGNAGLLAATRIEHAPGYCAEAVQLATDVGIPAAPVAAVPPGSETTGKGASIIVTLGRDSL